jgi:lipopolysaccharide heptosyltransferase II
MPRPLYSRILISRMKFIGDVVLTTPVIRSVRTAFPDAFIAYMGDAQAVALLEQNPFLNEIIPFDFARQTIVEQPRVAWLLRARKFDLALDLFGNPRSALLTYLSGARVRVGLERQGRGRLYTIRVKDEMRRKTAVEFHNQFLRAAGITPIAFQPEIFLSESERQDAAQRLSGGAKTVVGIHPGATWPAKRWFPERFAELILAVHKRMGARVILTAGPRDGAVIDAVLERAGSGVTVFSGLPLRSLAALVSQCSAFVSNDAGPMHIAAAVGTPTIGLFGPGEEDIWFPYARASGHTALRMAVPCHPCHLDLCNRPGNDYMECMKLLTVGDVLAAVERAVIPRSY